MNDLSSLALHSYAAAAMLYLAHLVRQKPLLEVLARIALGSGLLLHAVSVASAFWTQRHLGVGLPLGLSLLVFLALAILLAVDLTYRRPVIGAFVTPVALAVLLSAGLLPTPVTSLPAAVRSPLLPVHITIAVSGVAAIAVAAGVAVMYLLMDRQMKGKRFGLLFSRLPPLVQLDAINRTLVVFGFVALSITLATGALFDQNSGGWHWDPKRVATAAGWTVFAVLLAARLAVGWRGKRAALVTIAGFAILVVSFVSAFELGGP